MLSLLHSFATQMQPIMTTDPTTTMTTTTNTNAAMPTSVIVTYLVVIGIFIVLAIVCNWIIFRKLGEKGWKSIIPIYSQWTFLKLGDKPGWWAILALIPIVNIVAAVMVAIAAYTIGLKLHKPGWYVVLYIIISPLWYLILAFSSDSNGSEHISATGFVDAPALAPPVFPQTPPTPVSTPPTSEGSSNTPNLPPPTQF